MTARSDCLDSFLSRGAVPATLVGQHAPLMRQIAFRIRGVAEWCKVPAATLEKLRELADRVAPTREQCRNARQLTPKNWALLDRFEDERFETCC